MDVTRREFMRGAVAGVAGATLLAAGGGEAGPRPVRIRVGACTVGIDQAREAGLEGVEVGVGGPADRLWIARPDVRQDLKAKMRGTGAAIPSLMMGLLNSNPLAADPRGPAWLAQSIEAAQDLGAKVILVAFFGAGSLLDESGQLKRGDIDVVVQRLRAAAPLARKAGVTLAIENTLSAQQNREILDRVGSPAVRVYYDVGNSAAMGYDVPAEIRALKGVIAQFHFKDGGSYLGEGRIAFAPIGRALRDIGYQGWIILETSAPSGDGAADAKRNAAFVRKLLA